MFFEFFLKNIKCVFKEELPLGIFVVLKVVTDSIYVIKNTLNSAILIALSGLGIIPKNMLDLEFFSSVFKEVPVIWWSNSVDELSLFDFGFGICFKFGSTIIAFKSFFFKNTLIMIVFDNLFNFIWFNSFKTFEQYIILDILKNHVIYVFKLLGSF